MKILGLELSACYDEGGTYRNIHDDRRYVAVLPSRKNAEMESLSVSEERVVLERRNIALALVSHASS
jgi:hypothetical protein